jgi:hypothetical protein
MHAVVTRSIIVFDSGDAARQATERMQQNVSQNPGVALNGVAVGEVVANA